MDIKLGYLVPEFPGQTHIFFWRELKVLREQGIDYEILSTRMPAQEIISHKWAKDIIPETTYLFPLKPTELLGLMPTLFRAGPKKLWQCLQASLFSPELTFSDRIKTTALILVGAHMARIAKERQINHIHAHSCANAANIAMFCKMLGGINYSITLHGGLKDYGSNQKNKWRHSSFAIVITKKLHQEVTQLLSGYLPNNVVIAPMGVEISKFSRPEPYQPWNEGDTLKIFSCGRLNPCKGHDDLIRAASLIKKEGIPVCLTIAGEDDSGTGDYKRKLISLIDELNLTDEVKLIGAVPEERIIHELCSSHIFALASLGEPLGVAIMEAMAAEVPTIATSGGGVTELIDTGVHGILVSPKHPDEIFEAIKCIIRDPAFAKSISQAAKQRVAEEFHIGRSASVLIEQIKLANQDSSI